VLDLIAFGLAVAAEQRRSTVSIHGLTSLSSLPPLRARNLGLIDCYVCVFVVVVVSGWVE